LFTKRGEQIGASLKHILGNIDDRIQKSDALAAVKKSNKLVNEKLDQMQKEYEIKLQFGNDGGRKGWKGLYSQCLSNIERNCKE